jgi:ABC-type branched-subunit amino acid transport system substrate-binding protein
MTNDLAGEGGTPYAAVTGAVQAYLSHVSEELGGVCGRDVVVMSADDRYTPEIALEETRRLVEEEDVLAMIRALSERSRWRWR